MKDAPPLTVVVTQLPPAVCGIGDYTMNLVQAWPEERPFQFIVTRGAAASQQALPEYKIIGASEDAQGLAEALEKLDAEDVMLQYSGFGFDPKGRPLWIAEVFAAWKKKKPSRRLAVMFHELWIKWPWWDPRSLRSWLHRRSVSDLLKVASNVYTNTEGYAVWLRKLNRHVPVQVIPVGSNVTVESTHKTALPERGLMVVFGKQGTRMLALNGMKEALAKLAQKKRLTRLVIAGGAPDGAKAELAVAKEFLAEDQVTVTGFLEDSALSQLLFKAEFGLSGQDWLSVEKSTTFMAYAAHGLNILSPHAGKDSRTPFAWITSADELLTDDVQMEQKLRDRSLALREWYESTASWSAITARMSASFKVRTPACAGSLS